MKLHLRLFFILVLGAGNVFPQAVPQQQRIDSLTAKLAADSAWIYRNNVLRPYANIDNRSAFIVKQPSNISGLQIGVNMKGSHIVGFGMYTFNPLLKRHAPVFNNYEVTSLQYFTFFYASRLVNTRYFGLDLPFEIGLGRYSAGRVDSLQLGAADVEREYGIIPMGAGAKIILKPVRWAGISLAGGYRYVIERKPLLLNLDGAYYSVGLWLDLRQIYRDTRYYRVKKRHYRRRIKEIRAGS